MEEYVWISKVAHHPVFTDRAHPVLLSIADHYNVSITVAGSDDAATEPYVKAVYDAIQRKVAGMMVIGWGNEEIVPAIDAAVNSGIPVVCVDSDIPGSKRLAYIGKYWEWFNSITCRRASGGFKNRYPITPISKSSVRLMIWILEATELNPSFYPIFKNTPT